MFFLTDQPKFDRSHETVSVVVGKRALLPCYVSIKDAANNGNSPFKIIWMKLNNSSILTMEDRAINGDPRISLLHAYADEWNLQIDDIDEDDAGIYQCVINTGMYKTLTLDVKVPPKIIDELTTEPYPSPIRSGSNFTIKCYAHGKPMPKIRILSYDQSDDAKIISEHNEVTLYDVSRHTRRRYECIASNGYPPDVARSFQLTVQYAPELNLVYVSKINDELTSSLVFIDSNQHEIRLKCLAIMNPLDRIYWTKDNHKLINNHRMHQHVSTSMDNFIISELVIKEFSNEDQGDYLCVASNSLGTSSKSIQLLLAPTTLPPSTTTTTTIISTTFITTTTSSSSIINELSASLMTVARRKRPKHTRTTTTTTISQEFFRSTELLREMTITSSQAINTKYQMMTLYVLLFVAAYF
ncbi:unnamed protein product [Rotaria socialis]|uniref:Ig-like domain-containing protein n=1 Tax=Rotaria socialis TaxID=392032 RepID=A0A817N6U4_9BILA|nr:unnamed protein product [Rotaria socialis]